MVQEVSRRPHKAEVRFDPDPVIVGFVVAKVVLGQSFLRALQFYPIIIPPVHFLYHRHFILFEIDCVVKQTVLTLEKLLLY
jgi:hypothetical protein